MRGHRLSNDAARRRRRNRNPVSERAIVPLRRWVGTLRLSLVPPPGVPAVRSERGVKRRNGRGEYQRRGVRSRTGMKSKRPEGRFQKLSRAGSTPDGKDAPRDDPTRQTESRTRAPVLPILWGRVDEAFLFVRGNQRRSFAADEFQRVSPLLGTGARDRRRVASHCRCLVIFPLGQKTETVS